MKKKIFILVALVASFTIFSTMSLSEVKKVSFEGHMGEIEMEIEVKGEQIVKINVLKHNESPRIGGRALKELGPIIIEKQTYDVDSIVGATMTSEALKKAVKESLGK